MLSKTECFASEKLVMIKQLQKNLTIDEEITMVPISKFSILNKTELGKEHLLLFLFPPPFPPLLVANQPDLIRKRVGLSEACAFENRTLCLEKLVTIKQMQKKLTIDEEILIVPISILTVSAV